MRYFSLFAVFLVGLLSSRSDAASVKCKGGTYTVPFAINPAVPDDNSADCETECAVYVKAAVIGYAPAAITYSFGCGTSVGLLTSTDKKAYLVGDWVGIGTDTVNGNVMAEIAAVKTTPVACFVFGVSKRYPKGPLHRTVEALDTASAKASCLMMYTHGTGYEAKHDTDDCATAHKTLVASTVTSYCCKTFWCDSRDAGPLSCLSSKNLRKPVKDDSFVQNEAGSQAITMKECFISYSPKTRLWTQGQDATCTDTPTNAATTDPEDVTHCCTTTNCNNLEGSSAALHCYNNGGTPGPLAWKFNLKSSGFYCKWTRTLSGAEYVQQAIAVADVKNTGDQDCMGVVGRVRTTASHYVYCCNTMLCNRPTDEWMAATVPPPATPICYSGNGVAPNTATKTCSATDTQCYYKYTVGSTSALPSYEQGCSTASCPAGATCSLGPRSNLMPLEDTGLLWCYDQAKAAGVTTTLKKCGSGETCQIVLSSDGQYLQGCADTAAQGKCGGKMDSLKIDTNDVHHCCNTHGCNTVHGGTTKLLSCLYTPMATRYPTRTMSKICPMGTQSCKVVSLSGYYIQGCASPTAAILGSTSGGCQMSNCNVAHVTTCYGQTATAAVGTTGATCSGGGPSGYVCYLKIDDATSTTMYTQACHPLTSTEFSTGCGGKFNEIVTDGTTSTTKHLCCTADRCNNMLPPTTTTTTTTTTEATVATAHHHVVTLSLLALVVA